MGDAPKKRSWAWIKWLALALVILYPLSMGPAYGPLMPFFDPNTLSAVYAPMWWVWQHSPWGYAAIEWYLNLWFRVRVPGMP